MLVGAARFELTTPAPKADDLPNFPSIESGIYGDRLLKVVEMTSYNSHYSAPLHSLRLGLSSLTETVNRLTEWCSAPAFAGGAIHIHLGIVGQNRQLICA